MTSKIQKLEANNNLDNIPHMLRNLAKELEDGAHEADAMLVISLASTKIDDVPSFFSFGKEVGRITQLGMLSSCITFLGALE